ncbi:unnamed protein product [Orchesella dallaii]|uniref:C2H2-type domain-containing protein n=1 Tax=Orchesella dallaii TaxID=48710 RepID=A0ABP1PXY8_9HEXA
MNYCWHCSKHFSRSHTWVLHMIDMHMIKYIYTHQDCNACDQKFKTTDELEAHLHVGNGKCKQALQRKKRTTFLNRKLKVPIPYRKRKEKADCAQFGLIPLKGTDEENDKLATTSIKKSKDIQDNNRRNEESPYFAFKSLLSKIQ